MVPLLQLYLAAAFCTSPSQYFSSKDAFRAWIKTLPETLEKYKPSVEHLFDEIVEVVVDRFGRNRSATDAEFLNQLKFLLEVGTNLEMS